MMSGGSIACDGYANSGLGFGRKKQPRKSPRLNKGCRVFFFFKFQRVYLMVDPHLS